MYPYSAKQEHAVEKVTAKNFAGTCKRVEVGGMIMEPLPSELKTASKTGVFTIGVFHLPLTLDRMQMPPG